MPKPVVVMLRVADTFKGARDAKLLAPKNLMQSFDTRFRHHQRTANPPVVAMNSFRVARTAVRAARPAAFRAPIAQRRGYAEAAADKIKLTLALPHQVRRHPLRSPDPELRISRVLFRLCHAD